MTLLAADIGNSHTVLGLMVDGEVAAHWRVSTDERRTSDEWAVLVRGLLREHPSGEDLTGIAVCSTVPAVLHEWREMLSGHFKDVPNVVVEPGVRTGVPVLMDNPRGVGADRNVREVDGLLGVHPLDRFRRAGGGRSGLRPGVAVRRRGRAAGTGRRRPDVDGGRLSGVTPAAPDQPTGDQTGHRDHDHYHRMPE